jgi:ATP-binding cassette, subfamily F, member 3
LSKSTSDTSIAPSTDKSKPIEKKPIKNIGSSTSTTKPVVSTKEQKSVVKDSEIVAYSQQSRFHTETLETLSKEVSIKFIQLDR